LISFFVQRKMEEMIKELDDLQAEVESLAA
jgi:hypothetical protein